MTFRATHPRPAVQVRKELPAELDHPANDVLRALAHHQLLPGNERDDRIGRLLDQLDQVGIHHQRMVVQSSECNHVCRTSAATTRTCIGTLRVCLKVTSGR